MATLLVIEASASPQGPTRQLAAEFITRWLAKYPTGTVITRDMAISPIPHLSEKTISAMYRADKSAEDRVALHLSDKLIGELKQADTILVATPMYNFGIPSTLKAYFDHVTRVGETFHYTENGPQGLLENKPCLALVTSGSDYREPPLNQLNFVDGYLKAIFGFIGITNFRVIQAAGLSQGEEKSRKSMSEALAEIKLFNY